MLSRGARFLLLLALMLVPSLAWAQGGQYTNIASSLEPLPNCIPSTGTSFQPMIWDATAQLIKICTAVNNWTAITGGGGGGTNVQVNGVPLSSSSVANFENSNAFNGLTFTFTDLGFGAIKTGFTGTLGDAGLTQPYSGVGSCGAHTWYSTLTRNANGTCTQPAFTDILGSIALAQLPAIPGFSVLGNGTGSSATPTGLASIGAGTNPIFGVFTSLAQGQIVCANSTPQIVNCTPGIPVIAYASSFNVSNTGRATLGVISNSSAPVAVTLPNVSTLPNNMFQDFVNVNTQTATFTAPGGGNGNMNCSGPGSATTQLMPQGWFGILYNDGGNYCLPTVPTTAAFDLANCAGASNCGLSYNATTKTFYTVTASGSVSSGTGGQLAGYAATGTTVSGLPNFTFVNGALTAGTNSVAGSLRLNDGAGNSSLLSELSGGGVYLGSTNAFIDNSGNLSVASCAGCTSSGAYLASTYTNSSGTYTAVLSIPITTQFVILPMQVTCSLAWSASTGATTLGPNIEFTGPTISSTGPSINLIVYRASTISTAATGNALASPIAPTYSGITPVTFWPLTVTFSGQFSTTGTLTLLMENSATGTLSIQSGGGCVATTI